MGRERGDYYALKRLDPAYRVFFGRAESADIASSLDANYSLFNSFEKDGGFKLKSYIGEAEEKYRIAMEEFLYRDYRKVSEFLNPRILFRAAKLSLFDSLHSNVSKMFSDVRSRRILEYPMVFLGNSPNNAPALYSLMSHVDLNLGVWYPEGGMGKVVDAFLRLCEEFGVDLKLSHEVESIECGNERARRVNSSSDSFECDAVVVNADYHHAEADLLSSSSRSLDERYWKKKIVAPSMFLIYLGIKGKIENLLHHNLYFSDEWDSHFKKIFEKPAWPQNPSYYVSVTSKSDDTAPDGCENLFILVPVSCDLDDSEEIRNSYAETIISNLEKRIGEPIRERIVVKRIFSHRDFKKDYNAFKGTALGLAHSLSQTAVFRPPRSSRKVKNLFYTGQYTHPGIGVPMTIISATLTAKTVKEFLG